MVENIVISIVVIAVAMFLWRKLMQPVKVVIKEYEIGVLMRNGKIISELGAGAYTVYKGFLRNEEVVITDTREQSLSVNSQEIMTKDGVCVKFNILVQYKIVDAKMSLLKLPSLQDKLYQSVQLHLRAVVVDRNVQDVMSGRNDMNVVIKEALTSIMPEFGVSILDAQVKDVSLDNEMRMAMSAVVKAQKEAQAVLESTREKIASSRALANVAQIMQENPHMYKLKQLDILQKAAERGGNTFIVKLNNDEIK
ncbi:MAG: hypothetical protein A2986_00840 [Candidatus Jacksonbacteria bacterium RIFCSPLOWO2_01_FULL_44_13]|nr:MAG: hypothetical protein A2986_00840 [Candidatus Jacksonbacteria bacterium RIFCSPLOWO2_01_FULL_44_13]